MDEVRNVGREKGKNEEGGNKRRKETNAEGRKEVMEEWWGTKGRLKDIREDKN